MREQLHGFPEGYTAQGPEGAPLDERTRARLLANSWHAHVAQTILAAMLGIAPAGPDSKPPPALLVPAAVPPMLHPDGSSTLDRLLARIRRAGLSFAPFLAKLPEARLVPENESPQKHLELARAIAHPGALPDTLDDTAEFAIKLAEELGRDLPAWRAQVLADIKARAEDMKEDVDEWWARLPDHVREAYSPEGRGAPIVAPLLFSLLRDVGFPDAGALHAECTEGFRLLGAIPRGVDWPSLAAPQAGKPHVRAGPHRGEPRQPSPNGAGPQPGSPC